MAWAVMSPPDPLGPRGPSGGKLDSMHSMNARYTHVMPGIDGVWQPCINSLGLAKYKKRQGAKWQLAKTKGVGYVFPLRGQRRHSKFFDVARPGQQPKDRAEGRLIDPRGP